MTDFRAYPCPNKPSFPLGKLLFTSGKWQNGRLCGGAGAHISIYQGDPFSGANQKNNAPFSPDKAIFEDSIAFDLGFYLVYSKDFYHE